MVIKKKLSSYDRRRLEDYQNSLQKSRKEYLAICEAMFLHDIQKPNSKTDYPKYEVWLRERVNLERKMRHIIRNYEKIFVRYVSLAEVIEEEINKGVY